MYKNLNSEHIVETIEQLGLRINERFAGSGLGAVCAEFLETARQTSVRCSEIKKPNIGLRIAIGAVIAVILFLVGKLFAMTTFTNQVFELSQFIQSFQAFLESFVYLGAIGVFLISVENRIKRRKALSAFYEMRSFAHVVDMHQLTKDPEVLIFSHNPTPSSPERRMSSYEMSRYFDYCSEMLSLISKVAALYIQDFKDNDAMEAVDQIEDLTTGLSQKIWQKAALLITHHQR